MLLVHQDNRSGAVLNSFGVHAKGKTMADIGFSYSKLQMHKAQIHDMRSPHQFIIERDVIPGSTACAHCGKLCESMTSMARHLKMQFCTEFDANKESDTPLTRFDDLRVLVETGNCAALLQEKNLLQVLSSTCALCQQEFKHKGNLVHHINSRHGSLAVWVQPQVIALEDFHRGPNRSGVCPGHSNKKQVRTHRCIVFLQFAILQEFHRLKKGSKTIPTLDAMVSSPAGCHPTSVAAPSGATVFLIFFNPY